MINDGIRPGVQVVFGVLGDAVPGDAFFSDLAAATAASNPGCEPVTERAAGSRIGHAVRSFNAWLDPLTNCRFFLEGELHSIDGRDTTERGASHAEQAAVVDLYRRHGPELWGRLGGSFLLVVQDDATFRLGVDVVGTRSIYWWLGDGMLGFHSQLVDLAEAVPGRLTEDFGAIGSFLECGRFLPGETPYREIHHLGAGQSLTVANGQATVRDHFSMEYDQAWSGKRRSVLVDEVVELLERSIARAWRNARDPVLPLSGGLDSRYIAAELVRQHGTGSLPTITWGEARDRPGGDALVAVELARRLGLPNVWYEKPQRHSVERFARALYLSSGESDCAIHYPDDHVLHARLAADGRRSMFRGDECFGATRRLLTRSAILAVNGIAPLALDPAYRPLLGDDLVDRMATEQRAGLVATMASIRSRTPTAGRDEIWYGHGVRRFLALYNRVKNADLEVYLPLLDPELLAWLKHIPDALRSDKTLLHAALERRFPELASLPFATDSNLPRWGTRIRRDPALAMFLADRCAEPGWLDMIDARGPVAAGLARLAAAAGPDTPDDHERTSPRFRQWLKRTWPGQLLRERTLERRFAANLPPYLRLARLTVLHQLLRPRPPIEPGRRAGASGFDTALGRS